MYTSFAPVAGWIALIGALLFAWWKGNPAERGGSLLIVGAAFAVWSVHFLLQPADANLALLIIDAVMAAGFLILAIRYASLWLGAAMLLQGLQFSLHAYYLVIEKPHDRLYSIGNNVITFAIIGCILAGTLIAWRRRAIQQRAGL